ncbi:MAG: rod shape-determining protein MreC [Oscillospiraceae bacterium]|jgi:rod shape-determining protein MreC|nr:rod shape-determining protein MreC [Oscillospiraceae bacterium]
MKAILTRRTIIILSTALLLALITVVSVWVFNTSGPVTGFANTVTQPVRILASSVAQVFGDIFSAIYEFEALQNRNDELLRRIAELEAAYREAHDLAIENARLRALLDFGQLHGNFTQEMATLRSWTGDNFTSTFVINLGSANSNIANGMGVATEYGVLIGQVFSVGATESTVITILDTRFSAAAFVGRRDTGDEGESSVTAKGDFSYMRSGYLILDAIDDDLIVRPGDTVVTSGRGGVFPPGLIIGEVDDVIRHVNEIGRFAVVEPLLDIENLTSVFVITGFEITGD